ncbi:Transgelin-3 [Hondaea fermentalgiana]|uniref:Transgelin-3 n=1 Tax=Hondaea fermentalgiana TaxID=2315210 RepID=A0A2R5GAT9_9STRA|nr:Transgelin-3 [Hondaea fermentalgiana]|eukprot:GBG25663.1 Transgelin-3 [Hondaea fermentalgiana]
MTAAVADAAAWVEACSGTRLEGDFTEALRDGTILCDVVNKCWPDSVRKVYRGTVAFRQMENVTMFIKAARKIGVPSRHLFETVDLFELRDAKSVADTVLYLRELAIEDGVYTEEEACAKRNRIHKSGNAGVQRGAPPPLPPPRVEPNRGFSILNMGGYGMEGFTHLSIIGRSKPKYRRSSRINFRRMMPSIAEKEDDLDQHEVILAHDEVEDDEELSFSHEDDNMDMVEEEEEEEEGSTHDHVEEQEEEEEAVAATPSMAKSFARRVSGVTAAAAKRFSFARSISRDAENSDRGIIDDKTDILGNNIFQDEIVQAYHSDAEGEDRHEDDLEDERDLYGSQDWGSDDEDEDEKDSNEEEEDDDDEETQRELREEIMGLDDAEDADADADAAYWQDEQEDADADAESEADNEDADENESDARVAEDEDVELEYNDEEEEEEEGDSNEDDSRADGADSRVVDDNDDELDGIESKSIRPEVIPFTSARSSHDRSRTQSQTSNADLPDLAVYTESGLPLRRVHNKLESMYKEDTRRERRETHDEEMALAEKEQEKEERAKRERARSKYNGSSSTSRVLSRNSMAKFLSQRFPRGQNGSSK